MSDYLQKMVHSYSLQKEYFVFVFILCNSQIGKGSFGEVFLVQSIHDRSINHVLKKVNMHAMSEEERDAAMKEVCGLHDRPINTCVVCMTYLCDNLMMFFLY